MLVMRRLVLTAALIPSLGTLGVWEANAQGCIPPPAGLVSWWPGDGNGDDIAGNNDATLLGGLVFESGKVGPAFGFDGQEFGVKIDGAIVDVRQPYTIDAWVLFRQGPHLRYNLAILSKDSRPFLGTSLSLIDMGFFISNRSGTSPPVLGLCHVGGTCAVYSSGQIPLGQFVHVAITYDGSSTARFYINGQVDSVHTVIAGSNKESTWLIGNGGGDFSPADPDYGEIIDGLIDEVELFDRELGAAEIQALFDAGSAGKCKDTTSLFHNLMAIVMEINASNGIINSLDAKLNAALNALDDLNENNDAAAINSLLAFINSVQAQSGAQIDPDEAALLVSLAQLIIDQLSTD